MSRFTLKEVCVKTNVSRRAIQGYEKANLVKACGRNERGYLLYDEQAKQRIEEIRLFQKMGFSIKEIQSIYHASKDEVYKMIERQIDLLNKESQEIQEIIQFAKQKLSEL